MLLRSTSSLTNSVRFRTVCVAIAESAARLRVSLRLKLADFVQPASALAIDAAALVTHDRDLSRVKSLRVIS